MFLRTISPPSSQVKSNASKKQAEAGSKMSHLSLLLVLCRQRKDTHPTLVERLDRPQNQSWHCGEEKIFFPLSVIESWFAVQFIA
jgi:hypothetical protein